MVCLLGEEEEQEALEGAERMTLRETEEGKERRA